MVALPTTTPPPAQIPQFMSVSEVLDVERHVVICLARVLGKCGQILLSAHEHKSGILATVWSSPIL